MTTLFGLHAIWTDGEVMDAMYAIRNAINEWERVGAGEEVDLDEMAEVERRFKQAMGEFEMAMQVVRERERTQG